MHDYNSMPIARELPPAGHYTDRGRDTFRLLCGARIVQIGTPDDDAVSIEGGGLVIDFIPEGQQHPRRIVFGFNECGMWIEHEAPLADTPTKGVNE